MSTMSNRKFFAVIFASWYAAGVIGMFGLISLPPHRPTSAAIVVGMSFLGPVNIIIYTSRKLMDTCVAHCDVQPEEVRNYSDSSIVQCSAATMSGDRYKMQCSGDFGGVSQSDEQRLAYACHGKKANLIGAVNLPVCFEGQTRLLNCRSYLFTCK